MEIVPLKAASFQNGATYLDGTFSTLIANRSDYPLTTTDLNIGLVAECCNSDNRIIMPF